MTDELNRIVQNNIDNSSDIVVSSFIPGSDWSGTVWDPIYTKACGFDFDYSAQFFGLLVCKVLIDREEEIAHYLMNLILNLNVLHTNL